METVSSGDPVAVVLAADPRAAAPLPDDVTGRTVDPADADADAFADAALSVVRDADGLDRVREHGGSVPVVASVDDPTGDVATAPGVDAVATTAEDLSATVRWVLARDGTVGAPPARTPSRIERLNAGATRLASVRSTEAAHRAVVAIADEVFPAHRCVVGVRDGEWVEPVAASADVPIEDCNRVRVGAESAETVVETDEPVIEPNPNGERPYDTLLGLPVGDDTVFQLVTAGPDGFDDDDRRLAGLLASHFEETLDRIRVDEALRTERDRLLALFSNVPDPAVAYDYADGEPIVHRVNDAFEETFGYDEATVVGECVDDYIVPEEEAAIEEAVELNERLRRGENVRREVTRTTVDGPRHFILHVVPIRLNEENVSGYAIYTDVTERREREATLRRQNERLDEFASIVSHDLRNPLAVAQGYVDLASDTGDPAHVAKAEEALERMDELVGDLLSLARQGRSVGETEPVSIGALARDAWEGVDTGGAELVIESDVTLDADLARTRELLENVFRNSVEHGSTGNRTESDDSVEHGSTSSRAEPDDSVEHGRDSADALTVRVGEASFRSDGGEGTGFFVEDDGRGLPEEGDRVFESGFTTDEGGTGLGLAIGRRIAEAHGWEARALTGESGGARFEFRTS
ncbi:histidine kinase dimerization/phospho-acceptor domain-containing protein [Halorubrum rutilum]|uniref:histidine kinase n=1 Tax=Halorubrum rutilum TaxID=1364933 RepID=A0ABD6AIU3_9EURY|nr:histidine kinase dimerization/phospho-acceptor domain-containing protein [Halorubrum rutilum]